MLIIPDWPAPAHIKAFVTTRRSNADTTAFADGYAAFNLATHTGDDKARVLANRRTLAAQLGVPPEAMAWISQVHGIRVVTAEEALASVDSPLQADAIDTRQTGLVCSVLTADCLPVLLTDAQGRQVSAIHAGWRGLADGVIEAVLDRFDASAEILAWLGPAIGPQQFEVGAEVRQAFIDHDPQAATAFKPFGETKWLGDMYTLARQRLQVRGVNQIYGGGRCTVTEAELFYSYRRDGEKSGRMATGIWMAGGCPES
jgi:polyphenol oxidase